METFLKEFQHLKVQLEEIKSATGNFDDKEVIRNGGFGKVYKGELSHFKGRSMVAFKRLDRSFGQGDPEFWKEIMMLSRYTHENLISLLGFCDEDGEKILVYEHASNGSLDRHLSSTTFTWTQRLKICLDAARGLSYLHDDKGTQQRVLHRDIKSSNILLDEYWNAKVSDMGLSKIWPANQQHTALVTNIVGTLWYLDPMYMEFGILTKESDVYSFGVVLFEVLCGRLCFENVNGRSQSLVRKWKQTYIQKKLDEIIFRDLVQEMDPGSLETYSDIAFQCLQEYHEGRPTMSLVVKKLEAALEFQEIYEDMKHPVDYENIIKTAVQPLTYKSEEELKLCLYKGILLDWGYTWFSLNKNGEHYEMISATDCHIQAESAYPYDTYVFGEISRFSWNKLYIVKGIRYRLEGVAKYSVSCLADVREDGWFMAELFQFESQRRNVDIEISFEGVRDCLSYHHLIEGIEFRPIEKEEHEVLKDDTVDNQTMSESDDTYWEDKLPNDYEDIIKWSKEDVKWATKKELYSILCKGFLMSGDQGWFFLAKSGKNCLMLPARATLVQEQWKWTYNPESRFGQVAFDFTGRTRFSIIYNIESQII